MRTAVQRVAGKLAGAVREMHQAQRLMLVLRITPKTASVHVSNILAKLGAASRTEAAAIAYREGA